MACQRRGLGESRRGCGSESSSCPPPVKAWPVHQAASEAINTGARPSWRCDPVGNDSDASIDTRELRARPLVDRDVPTSTADRPLGFVDLSAAHLAAGPGNDEADSERAAASTPSVGPPTATLRVVGAPQANRSSRFSWPSAPPAPRRDPVAGSRSQRVAERPHRSPPLRHELPRPRR